MELYFLRHADAGDYDSKKYPDDSKRPLTEEGFEKTRLSAKAMKKAGFWFDRVISSPFVRARQTAETVLKTLKWDGKLELYDGLKPEAGFEHFSKILNQLDEKDSVLFVGHNPSISHFT